MLSTITAIFNFVTHIANALIKGLGLVLEALVVLLPRSPFPVRYDIDVRFLSGLGWIVPIDLILTTLTAWIACVGIFYVYMTVLRWVRVLG